MGMLFRNDLCVCVTEQQVLPEMTTRQHIRSLSSNVPGPHINWTKQKNKQARGKYVSRQASKAQANATSAPANAAYCTCLRGREHTNDDSLSVRLCVGV